MSGHLVVLPAPHEVLVRFNIVPHLQTGDHLETAHLEHHPAAPLSFQVAIHLEKLATLSQCCSISPSRVPGQG